MNKTFLIKNEVGMRLDKALTLLIKDVSRSYIQKLINENLVLVNNEITKANYVLKANDKIEVTLKTKEVTLNAKPLDLDIIYEDEYLLVVNKPSGLVVHPGAGKHQITLAHALLHHSQNLSSLGGPFRPGIVHRLDKETSGLIIVAKNDFVHEKLAKQIKARSVERVYHTLVQSIIFEDEGQIIASLSRDQNNRLKQSVNVKDGKEAITFFKVLERFSQASHVQAFLKTGRTHQIRAHFAYINHPLIGDKLYEKGPSVYRVDKFYLHASSLSFIHPISLKEVTFNAPLPDDFVYFLKELSN